MGYFEDMFAKKLRDISNHRANNRGMFDIESEKDLIQEFDRAKPDLAYELLERLNKSKDEYYKIFNTDVSPGTRTRIRETLVKTHISNLNRKETESLLQLIYQSRRRLHKKIALLLYNNNQPIELAFLVSLVSLRLKEIEEERRIYSSLAQTALNWDKDPNLMPADRMDRLTLNRLAGSKSENEKIARGLSSKRRRLDEKFPVEVGVRRRAEELSIRAFYLSPIQRQNVEDTLVMVCELSHAELIAALIQFRVNGLEERISNLEKANQSSWWSFLGDLAFNFVMPFALGKIIKYAGSTITKKSEAAYKEWMNRTQAAQRSWRQKIAQGLKPEQRPFISFEGNIWTDLNKYYQKISPFLQEHLDDFTQAGTEVFLKVKKFNDERPRDKTTNANNISDFIADSISKNRQEILRLRQEIADMPDDGLIIEINKKMNKMYEFIYKQMNDKLDEYLLKEKKERERRKKEEQERSKREYEKAMRKHTSPYIDDPVSGQRTFR